MNSQLIQVKNKTAFHFLFITTIGLLSPILIAQKAIPIPEEQVQYLEDTIITRGDSQELEGLKSTKNSFAVGDGFEYSENIDIYRISKKSGLEFIVNTRAQDWRNLNTGDGSRGSGSLILFRF